MLWPFSKARNTKAKAMTTAIAGYLQSSFIWDTSVRAHCQRPMSKLDVSIVIINLLAVENVSLSLIILIRNSYNGVE